MARQDEERIQPNLFDRAGNVQARFSAMSQAQRPNYRMLAPAQPAQSPTPAPQSSPSAMRSQPMNAGVGRIAARQRANLGMGPRPTTPTPTPRRQASIDLNRGLQIGAERAERDGRAGIAFTATPTTREQYEASQRPPLIGRPEDSGMVRNLYQGIQDNITFDASAPPRTTNLVRGGGQTQTTNPVRGGGQNMVSGSVRNGVEVQDAPLNSIASADGMRSLQAVGPNGQATADRVNTFDMGAANREFARANEIRQRAVDAQPRGAGIVIPEYSGGRVSDFGRAGAGTVQGMLARAQQLEERAAGENRGTQRGNNRASALRQQARALRESAGVQGAIDRTTISENAANDRAALNASIEGPYRQAMGEAALTEAQASQNYWANRGGQGQAIDPADRRSLLESMMEFAANREMLAQTMGPQQLAALEQGYANAYAQLFPQQNYADGGLVDTPMSAMQRTPMMTPEMPLPEDVQRYQQLQQGLSAMGLAPVDFESFMQMRQASMPTAAAGAPQPGVMGFADGGMVPDASGMMVVDADPNAPVDSIPAMIDGQQPAALDSGEFVIPRDVVLYYGTDKLKKMIAKAREPEAEGNGGDQSPGISAIQAALSAG